MRPLFMLIAIISPIVVSAQHTGMKMPMTKEKTVMAVGLGNVNHPVSTRNAEAQRSFNDGLAYIYGFNHDEAVRSFQHAADLDPNLAMAYWGISLARGSNYNVPAFLEQLREAWDNLQKAIALKSHASQAERDYIDALSKRYSSDPTADAQKLAVDYSSAMRLLSRKYPNDLDAATLFAESMMNLHPWQLWSLDGKPADGTLEIISVLESVLKRNPNHPGANHYYIHAVEASPNPERGLPSARRLGLVAPNAGHLVHMPSHIYIRTGDYARAAKSNADAIVADEKYIKNTGVQGLYPMMYYNHNVHFLASMNSMRGRYADAIRGSRELESNVRPHLTEMPMLEGFYVYPLITLVRFHKWDEIRKLPEPDEKQKLTAAYVHFARGMALAATGAPNEADKELAAFRQASASVPADASVGNTPASSVLKVAEDLLAGMALWSRGNKEGAIDRLTAAVASGDVVNYDEPPDWDLPVREWLGSALLQTGKFADAENVYRAELRKHPNNGRALFGLSEALSRQKKYTAAQKVKAEYKKAWAVADTALSVSDFAH